MSNLTTSHPTYFLLLGLPGLESSYVSIAFIFFFVYLISVIGNLSLLFIIWRDRSLHEPMYIFLFMLSSIDLVLTNSIIPKLLSILWLHSQEIYFDACLTQMFFIHTFATMESVILLAMAFDRYLAICHPLQYNSLLTNRLISLIGLGSVGRGIVTVLPLPFLFRRLSLCGHNVIQHSFCDHIALLKLACSDITVNSMYGLVVLLFNAIVDLIFIICSYVLILRAVFNLSSTEARFKALSTCTSHICVILVLYITAVLSATVQRFGKNIPLYVIILVANIYLVLPPFINPIVYGVRTRQIRNRIKRLFHRGISDINTIS